MAQMQARSSGGTHDVRTRARGKWFMLAVVGAWPLGLLIGLAATLFGAGMPVAIASGLCVALGINFVWVVITFAVDDGTVDDTVRADGGGRTILEQQDTELREALARRARDRSLR